MGLSLLFIDDLEFYQGLTNLSTVFFKSRKKNPGIFLLFLIIYAIFRNLEAGV
jgi:hypothetical protein